jgi:hypothetical protein
MRSYEFTERAWLGRRKRIQAGLSNRYRRNRANFQFGTSFETDTRPPYSIYEEPAIPETTISQVHELGTLVRREWKLRPGLRLAGRFDAAPVIGARLTTLLPVKYPGEKIVFASPAWGVNPGVAMVLAAKAVSVEISADYGRYWSYGNSEFRRESLEIGLRIAWSAGE